MPSIRCWRARTCRGESTSKLTAWYGIRRFQNWRAAAKKTGPTAEAPNCLQGSHCRQHLLVPSKLWHLGKQERIPVEALSAAIVAPVEAVSSETPYPARHCAAGELDVLAVASLEQEEP